MCWERIKKSIEENGNIKTFPMIELRNALKKQKLGKYVVQDISRALAKLNIGNIPKNLPSSQDATVRLYVRGTPIGDFIEDIMTPDENTDQKIIKIFESITHSQNNEEIIYKIRQLVNN